MSINRKKIIRNYTIVEVMVAMGIFLIMMTIMMQFFTSAQKVWNASAKRNMIYADARVAMNLMTREIQSILYYNDSTDLPNSIYPFWYEWTRTNADGNTRASEIENHYTENNELFEYSGSAYLTALNFISTTDLKPFDRGSDVCEIRYRFAPIYYNSSPPTTPKDISGGKLQRSCTAEYDSDGNQTSGTLYNFADIPLGSSNSRTTDIWSGTSSASFDTVIDGVYSLRFTCYRWSGTGLALLPPMDTGANQIASSSLPFDLSTGTPAPVAVRIDMKLMDPKDLKQLALNIYREQNGTSAEQTEATKQIKTLKQKIRTFSKVIYLGKRED